MLRKAGQIFIFLSGTTGFSSIFRATSKPSEGTNHLGLQFSNLTSKVKSFLILYTS